MSDILPTRPPWKTDAYLIVAEVPGGRPGGEVIAQCRPTRSGILTEAQNKANAEFIVRMVNASLSPIALDFEAAEDEARKKRHQYENAEVGVGCRDPLDAQLRALVARVAQEEREKYEGRIKECLSFAKHKPDCRLLRSDYAGCSCGFAEFCEWWRNSHLRGTP